MQTILCFNILKKDNVNKVIKRMKRKREKKENEMKPYQPLCTAAAAKNQKKTV